MRYIRLTAFSFNALIAFMVVAVSGNWVLPAQELTLRTDIKLEPVQIVGSVELTDRHRYNWGVKLDTSSIFPVFPIVLKAGKLSNGGSLSRLNSPELGSSLNVSTRQVGTSGITASLPSHNLFGKDESLYFKAGALSFTTDKESFAACFDFKKKLGKKIESGVSFTGGFFPYKKAGVDTWFSSKPLYEGGNHYCAGGQFCLKTGSTGVLVMANAFETPYGSVLPVFRVENYIKFKRFSFNGACFYNPFEGSITSSGKVLNPLLQVKAVGQYHFAAGQNFPLIIKTGFGAQADIKLNQNEHSIKTTGQVKFTTALTDINLTAKNNFTVKQKEQSLNIDFSGGLVDVAVSHYFKAIKPEVTARFSYTPGAKKEWTYSEKLGINFNMSGKINITSKNSVTFTQKKEHRKINFSCALGIKFSIKKVCTSVNLSVEH